jgi:hypothetical protein
MKESTKEDLANHVGLELYADGGNVIGEGTTFKGTCTACSDGFIATVIS